jgi:hypothetical protein
MAFSSLSFALGLALLYLVCAVFFPSDGELGKWAVVVTTLLPLGHFLSAPMSDGPYLALALAVVYFSARGCWLVAGLCGFLAALTRSQGVILMGVAGLILWYHCWNRQQRILRTLWCITRRGWVLMLIPGGLLLFTIYRAELGLASLDSIYAQESQRFFVNPLEGLWLNLRWWVLSEPANMDLWVLASALVGSSVLLARTRLNNLPLTAYTILHLAVFLTPINYQYDTNIVSYTQSIGRYCLALFPLTILLAQALQRSGRRLRLLGFAVLILMALMLSARHVLGLLGP